MENAEKTFRLLVVGCGVISEEWLSVLAKRPDCVAAGLVDLNPASAEEKKQKYGIDAPVYVDFDTALAETMPEIVVNLANAPAHCTIDLKSFAAGCHVFSEKPMCMSREEEKILLDAAEKAGVTFNVMQNRRFLPGIRALRHAVQSGALGEIWTVVCEIYVNADLRGGRNDLPYPMLQDQAIHSFDSARFILGADAKTVYCHSYNPAGSHYRGDGSGACIFEMENGTVLVYNAVMDTNVMKTAWHSQFRVIGTKGTAFWNGFDELPEAELVGEDIWAPAERVRLPLPPDWNGISWFAGAIGEMLTALKESRPSELDYRTNTGSMNMMFAAVESAKRREKVPV